MRFRSRLLAATLLLALVPIAALAIGVRHQMRERLRDEYRDRAAAMAALVEAEILRLGADIAGRLAQLGTDLAADNRFRLAASGSADRRYVLDYAASAMRTTGLSMFQIQAADGRIVSSGHFRNAYDQLDPGLPRALVRSGGPALLEARTPDTTFLALAQSDSVRIGGRTLTLVGGMKADASLWGRLVGEGPLGITIVHRTDTLVRAGSAFAIGSPIPGSSLPIPLLRRDGDVVTVDEAVLTVGFDPTPLEQLLGSVDRWFLAVAGAMAGVAMLAALWLAARISRPIAQLADRTKGLDLDRLDVVFDMDRRDEIGDLARLLDAMMERLRSSIVRLREAERRAAVGDLARQINHDIKNGLTPIRNVLRHFEHVAREQPEEMVAVFRERSQTLEQGIAYLEGLSANYARLTPTLRQGTCNLNGIAVDVARGAAVGTSVVTTRLEPNLPPVAGDPVAVRRIVENVVGNAVESLADGGGEVVVATESVGAGAPGSSVRVTITDTGKGMSREELERAFQDFYTTKSGGTGLGLSIVRRLVLDLGGTLRVITERGAGSSVVIELPAAPAAKENVT